MGAWLRFFRVKNLLTVPGDVLVGVAATFAVAPGCSAAALVRPSLFAAAGGVLLYMFGLADNDVVGAPTDPKTRPLVSGEISMTAARLARGTCLVAALGAGVLAGLPAWWRLGAMLLVLAIVLYNRTKSCWLMGLCRGLNVLCGAWALGAAAGPMALGAAAVWTAYVAGVTKYSEREVFDPTNERKVALLVFGLLGLQLAALVLFALMRSLSA